MTLIRRKRSGQPWETAEEDSGGSQTPPVTFTGTDPAEAVLTLEADPAQTELVFRVYDKNGDLAVDIDEQGKLDTRVLVVQDPPDTGGGPTEGSAVLFPGGFQISTDGTTFPIRIKELPADGASTYFAVKASGQGDICEISPQVASDVAVQIIEHAAQSANLIEIWDNPFNNMLFAVTKGGGILFPTADPHVAGAWWDNAGTLTRSAG